MPGTRKSTRGSRVAPERKSPTPPGPIDPALATAPSSPAPAAPPNKPPSSDIYISACHSIDGFLNSSSVKPGNVVWNLMGQVAMTAGREAIIVTPHTPPFSPSPSSERPPPPKLKVVITDDTAELPSVPPGHDLIPCWISRLAAYWDGYETSRLQTRQVEVTLLEEGNESNFWIQPRELSIKSLAWSPNGLSKAGGCLLAVLDTSLRVTLRATAVDWLRGDYDVVSDVTSLIADELRKDAETDEDMDGASKRSAVERALELQSMSLAWSIAPVFDAPVGIKADSSLLAVGNRGGGVFLIGYNAESNLEALYRSSKLTDQYITHLAWSEWKPAEDGVSRVASLFCACPDGSIFSLDITRTPVQGSVPLLKVGLKRIVYEADLRSVSGLVHCHGVLAWTKTGTVQILSEEGYVETFQLKKMGGWAGCTAYAAAAGIGPLPGVGLLVSLNSGEQHVFTGINDDPRYDEEASKNTTSAMRKTFTDIDPDMSEIQVAPRVGGCALAPSLTGGGSRLLATIQEPFNLIDLSIPLDSERQILVSLTDLSTVDGLGFAPPFAEKTGGQLQTAAAAALPELANMLRGNPIPRKEGAAAGKSRRHRPTSRHSALQALRYDLGCSAELESLRQSLVLANWEAADGDGAKQATAEQSAARIGAIVTRSVLRWLQDVREVEATSFVESGPFVFRVLESASSTSLYRTDAEILQIFQKLSPVVQKDKREETCPVCDQPALLEEGEQTYRCGQGHGWGRCAVTLTLIETPFVRRCTTCQRRAKIKDAQMSPLEQDLLTAAEFCFWCGGVWRRMF